MVSPVGRRGGDGARDDGTWLAVETGRPTGSVAVWKGGLVFEQLFRIQGGHSERLLPAIDAALRLSDTTPADVSSFILGAGPGSFTGVRIAAAMAKGWAMAQGTTLYAYSSLLTVAAGCGMVGPVCAMFDARRDEVYAACYDLSCESPTERLAPGAWRIEALLAELANRKLQPSFAGDGAILHREVISEAFAAGHILPEHLGIPRAACLAWLRSNFPELGRVDDPAVWEPEYVRDWKVPEE